VRYFYDVNDLLYSFAVFAVILLLSAVILWLEASKSHGFLRRVEDPPLYFLALSAVSAVSADPGTGDPMMCCMLRDAPRLRRLAPHHATTHVANGIGENV
jgi:hypothetical protein